MGIRVGLAACVVVLSCFLHTAVSEHVKKKIIVKVPYVIKHIHHDHFKPVHIHKPVHKKKFEHHYNDHEGEIKHGGGWKENLDHPVGKSFSKQDLKIGKKTPYARFSSLKPISIQHDNEEHIDYYDSDGKESEFTHMGLSHNLDTKQRQKTGFKLKLGQRLEFQDDLGITGLRHNFDHESRYNFGSTVRKIKRNKQYVDEISRNNSKSRRPKPIEFASWVNSEASNFNGEDLNISDEGRDYPNRETHSFNNEGSVDSRQRKKKSNPLMWRSKEISRNPENEGWKPMVSVNRWKDVSDFHHNKGSNHAEQFAHSGEEYSGRIHEDIYSQPHSIYSEENAKTNNRYKKKKKQKWSKQIKIMDLPEESNNPEQLQHLDNQQSYQDERISYQNVPKVQTQIIKPLPFYSHQNSNQHIQKDSSEVGVVPYYEKGGNYHNQLTAHKHRKLPLQQQHHWTTQSINQEQQLPNDQLQQQFTPLQQPKWNNHNDPLQHQQIPVQPVWPQTTEQQPNHNQQQWAAFQQPNLNHHHDQNHQQIPVESIWPQNEQQQNRHLQQHTTVRQPTWNNQHDPQQNYQHQLNQPVEPVWLQTQPTPIVQPTRPSKMMWSGHHLQMPQHSMWYVQQHAVGEAPPMQVISVNQDPQHSQSLQIPQSLLPLGQEILQNNQHQALPPGWPLNHDRKIQNGHAPMQQWEQHVQTSGSDGPASSYKVEVINYMDQKGNRQ